MPEAQEQQTESLDSQSAAAEQEQVTPATAPTDASEQEAGATEGSETPRDEQGKFKPKVQQRIDEITRARHEAEREAAYWRQRAEAASGNKDGKAPSSPNEAPAKPSVDQFQDYADYVEALTEWKAEQKVRDVLSARDAEKAKEAESKVKQTKAEAWEARQAQTRASLPDYDEVVGLSDLQIAPHVAETLLDSDVGPAVAYHLAKNPDLAERINAMSPLAAAREIGRLESAVAKPAAAPANTISKAPPPITPVGTRATPVQDPDKMTTDDWLKWRQGQLSKKR